MRVPVQIVSSSPRLEAALRFAKGSSPQGPLSQRLTYLCSQLAALSPAAVASVYVLEGTDDLVLLGNVGFDEGAIGSVRLKVGQGITGTAVETLRPVTVDDARLSDQFAYFPHLREERYPAFLAVPLLVGGRPRGALVLQRESGPFSVEDVLLAVTATPALTAEIEAERPEQANLLLHGEGNRLGQVVGVAHVMSRALPRPGRGAAATAGRAELEAAFVAERNDVRALLERVRPQLRGPSGPLDELATVLEDTRLDERAVELLAEGLSPALALERIAGEYSRSLKGVGPLVRRAVDAEAFLGAVAHRLARLEPDRIRRGELLIGAQLPGLAVLRAFTSGATGAVSAAPSEASMGVALLTSLGLPALSGIKTLFESVTHRARLALDSDKGELWVNPTASQVAGWRTSLRSGAP